MAPDKRKPPDGPRRLSKCSVVADGFDFPRDSSADPKKQVSAAPPDFDLRRYPILACHYFGWRQVRFSHRLPAERGVVLTDGGRP